MLKQANVKIFEYHEHKQINAIELTMFQEHHVTTFAKWFEKFYFVLQHCLLSKEHAKILESVEKQTERSTLRFQY